MTVNHKDRTITHSDVEAKLRIKSAIDSRPVVRQAVKSLFDLNHSEEPDEDRRREKAIFAVYVTNIFFEQKVDDELNRP